MFGAGCGPDGQERPRTGPPGYRHRDEGPVEGLGPIEPAMIDIQGEKNEVKWFQMIIRMISVTCINGFR